MGTMEERKEAKRVAILDAAREEFLSAGFEAANMDRIASLSNVTKQTVYRYFPSKTDLFEATVRWIGKMSGADFSRHLDHPDTHEALLRFAEGFIRWHLEDEPLNIFRLLVAESGKSPEIVTTFFTAAPDETNAILTKFFSERLGVEHPSESIRLWTSMLLTYRDDVLLGLGRPGDPEIAQLAVSATRLMLADLQRE